jgi:hypothetical protein
MVAASMDTHRGGIEPEGDAPPEGRTRRETGGEDRAIPPDGILKTSRRRDHESGETQDEASRDRGIGARTARGTMTARFPGGGDAGGTAGLEMLARYAGAAPTARGEDPRDPEILSAGGVRRLHTAAGDRMMQVLASAWRRVLRSGAIGRQDSVHRVPPVPLAPAGLVVATR